MKTNTFILYMGLTSVLVHVFPACRSNPCQNDGTCRLISSSGQVVCNCRRGYSGPYCGFGEWRMAMGVRMGWMTADEDMSKQLKLRSAVVAFVVGANEGIFWWWLVPAWFQSGGRRPVICVLWLLFRTVCDYCVWGCVCRTELGVLQQQGYRLQRGGEHHGFRRTVSGVELGPALWRAPRWHCGCLTSQWPRGSRFLQVRRCLMIYPASAWPKKPNLN